MTTYTYKLPSETAQAPVWASVTLRVLLFGMCGSCALLVARVACGA